MRLTNWPRAAAPATVAQTHCAYLAHVAAVVGLALNKQSLSAALSSLARMRTARVAPLKRARGEREAGSTFKKMTEPIADAPRALH